MDEEQDDPTYHVTKSLKTRIARWSLKEEIPLWKMYAAANTAGWKGGEAYKDDIRVEKRKDNFWNYKGGTYSFPTKKRRLLESEAKKTRRPCNRRPSHKRVSRKSDEEWGAMRDGEIKDLLISDSNSVETGDIQRQPMNLVLVEEAVSCIKSPTVDELLEGSLSEGDKGQCTEEEWYKKED
jgi:hypothetical protein